ncbi:MAG: MoxR family ATPase [Planctomycetota bacterium]
MSDVETQVKEFSAAFEKLRGEVANIIVGQNELIEGVLIAVLAGGHVLLEGLPGLGKTRLVKTIADTLELKFSRIQCTPDLMPADILGTTILSEDERGQRYFQFQRGPVFSNLVLTDEINRATPKTQSALLQAMQEGAVTIGTTTHSLDQPFFVLATQNPIEMEGTYPLPEAQLDRFMLKLLVPRSDQATLVSILERTTTGSEIKPAKVLSGATVLSWRKLIDHIPVARPALEYVARLVLGTHPDQSHAPSAVKAYVKYGASPRGAQSIVMFAKVRALTQRRYNVALEDIRYAVRPALRHRLILNFEGEAAGIQTDAILDELLKTITKE